MRKELHLPQLKNYQIFISHAWSYNEDYFTVESWLNEAANFTWTNLSVPKHDPILVVEQLKYLLNNQMRPADAFLILGGMYVSHSEWIQYEINFARRTGRKILGIRPRGSTMMPKAVQDGADEVVGWSRDSVVEAVRRLVR
jgi:hypothetical protein